MSEPGTGKTCSVVSFCEEIVRLRQYEIKHSLSKIKSFVILVRSAFHIENIRQMIDKVCSGGLYGREYDRWMGMPCKKRRRRGRGLDDPKSEKKEDKTSRLRDLDIQNLCSDD